MFQAWAPVIRPELLEHLDNTGGGQRMILAVDASERVEPPF